MPKMKTKKTLLRRIRITKNGKILHKQISTGHLKVKWSSKRKFRKNKADVMHNKKYIIKLRRMIA